MPPIRF